jgi:putative copper export protein
MRVRQAAPYRRAMSKRDVVALVVLAASLFVVGLGCVFTYGVLREYADVCGETAVLEQVWLGGAGLGPVVAVVAVVLAIVVATIARRRGVRVAAAGLVVLALVGATASGAAGVTGKKAAWEDNPATYGSCGGYNS